MAQALEAPGEHMQQETPDELGCREAHHLHGVALPIIAPAEVDDTVLQGDETFMADSDAMGIAPEVRHYLLGACKGWLGINDPLLLPEGVQPLDKRGGLRQRRCPRGKVELALGEGGMEAIEILPAKDPREGTHGEQELPMPRRKPPVLLGGQGATRDETMHVEMLVQVLPPGMEDHRGPQASAQPAWVTPEGVQRVPRALEEERVEDTGISLGQRIQGVGECKHTVEIRDGQEIGQARLDPPGLGQRLALGAMPIATRMVPGLIRAAVVALQQVPTEGGRPALLDRAHHPELLPSQRMRSAIHVSIGTENVGDFQRLPRVLGRGVPVAHHPRAPSV
jgi:hypothetical protein